MLSLVKGAKLLNRSTMERDQQLRENPEDEIKRSNGTNSEDKFKEFFKKYKNCKDRKQFSSFEEIFDADRAEDFVKNDIVKRITIPSICPNRPAPKSGDLPDQRSCHCDRQYFCSPLFGLTHPSTWNVFEFNFPQGLIFIKNPFTPEGQKYWVSKCLTDYPKLPHITNMENLRRRKLDFDKAEPPCLPEENPKKFYEELRWITFGYHHDWDTKIYTEENHCEFPSDLAELTKYISLALRYKGFRAEAAIVNYYHLDSTLSGHVDRSERNMEAPLFSLSFGQTAIFLIGAQTKEETPAAVYLKSGDIAIMAGPSRFSYHGVPKVLPSEGQPWQQPDEDLEIGSLNGNEPKKRKLDAVLGEGRHQCELCNFVTNTNFKKSEDKTQRVLNQWSDFHQKYICKSRINLNVRQVLYPGQMSLNDSIASVTQQYQCLN